MYYIDDIPTIITGVTRGRYARGYTLRGDMTLAPCYLARAGGYLAHGDSLREAVRDAEAKRVMAAPIGERVAAAIARYGTDAKVPAAELFVLHNILTGSCEMGRREWCRSRGIDVERDSYTLREFCEMCVGSFGGDNIRLLLESINETTKDNDED